jgi:hypothetical protein
MSFLSSFKFWRKWRESNSQGDFSLCCFQDSFRCQSIYTSIKQKPELFRIRVCMFFLNYLTIHKPDLIVNTQDYLPMLVTRMIMLIMIWLCKVFSYLYYISLFIQSQALFLMITNNCFYFIYDRIIFR